MQELFSLGDIWVSDFLSENQTPHAKSELKLMLDDKGCVRLSESVDKSLMYGKYWYRSGINNSMKVDLLDVVASIKRVKSLQAGDIWLDIACNDGTMLEHVRNLDQGIITLGIDPADESYTKESRERADEIAQDYFSAEVYSRMERANKGLKKAKIVTTIAMFYDIEDPAKFIHDVRKVIRRDGLWVVQMSYTPLMLRQLAFDNICHEHMYYYSLFNIKNLFESNGFKVVDCQLNSVNGGSFRIFSVPDDSDLSTFADQSYRDVARFRVDSTLTQEKMMRIDTAEVWQDFFGEINSLRDKTRQYIENAKREGKKVWAYGASTKGNTMMQYFGLDNRLIDGIAERSPYKWGLRTVGTNIPIYSESQMREAKPDYLLILPWHFISEFIEREKEYLESGGKFIVPCPKFEIVGK